VQTTLGEIMLLNYVQLGNFTSGFGNRKGNLETWKLGSLRDALRPVRLAGGTPFSGRLELLHSGQWGTICNKNFTNTEVLVDIGRHWST